MTEYFIPLLTSKTLSNMCLYLLWKLYAPDYRSIRNRLTSPKSILGYSRVAFFWNYTMERFIDACPEHTSPADTSAKISLFHYSIPIFLDCQSILSIILRFFVKLWSKRTKNRTKSIKRCHVGSEGRGIISSQ